MSAEIVPITNYRNIPAMHPDAIAKVRELEDLALMRPQVTIATLHTLHGGIYTRSISIPRGVLITGALVKIPTTLVVSGHLIAYIGDETLEFEKYSVICAGANRKQAFLAIEHSTITMAFPTKAKTVEEAEEQFTDEAHRLWSRQGINTKIVTEE